MSNAEKVVRKRDQIFELTRQGILLEVEKAGF